MLDMRCGKSVVTPQAKWNEFADAFIDHFLPTKIRAARAVEFENLMQGSMNVWDYHMKFVELLRYAL